MFLIPVLSVQHNISLLHPFSWYVHLVCKSATNFAFGCWCARRIAETCPAYAALRDILHTQQACETREAPVSELCASCLIAACQCSINCWAYARRHGADRIYNLIVPAKILELHDKIAVVTHLTEDGQAD